MSYISKQTPWQRQVDNSIQQVCNNNNNNNYDNDYGAVIMT